MNKQMKINQSIIATLMAFAFSATTVRASPITGVTIEDASSEIVTALPRGAVYTTDGNGEGTFTDTPDTEPAKFYSSR